MSESWLFVGWLLRSDAPPPPQVAPDVLARLVQEGWQVEREVTGDAKASWNLRSSDLWACVTVTSEEPCWSVLILEEDLVSRAGEAQPAAVALVRTMIEVLPPWAGTSCFPFGERVPTHYDTNAPFRLRHVGGLVALSGAYLAFTDLDVASLEGVPSERVGDTLILRADDDLTVEEDAPAVAALAARLGIDEEEQHGS